MVFYVLFLFTYMSCLVYFAEALADIGLHDHSAHAGGCEIILCCFITP